jgi:glycosyltransferase involved in cell wall biosynthesis
MLAKQLRHMKLGASRPIHICLVSPCTGSYGGLEAYILTLGAFFQRQEGFQVRVVFKMVRGFRLAADLKLVLDETPVDVRFVDRASAALWREIAWADIVHGQNASPDIAVCSLLLRKPLVLTIHYNFLMKLSLRKILWRLVAHCATRRIYISDFVRRTWEGASEKNGSMMIHSVCQFPQGDAIPCEQRKGFVFAARWIENKGLDTLIKAYRSARFEKSKWPLRLIGTGPLREVVEAEIKRHSIEGIEVLGFVSDAKKEDVIRYAKWAVAPSNTNEDLGLVPFEARSVGVPCIVTRDGGLPESGGREALLCEPGSIDDLRRTLEKAAEMSDSEYALRSCNTRRQLIDQLKPLSYYSEMYRSLI